MIQSSITPVVRATAMVMLLVGTIIGSVLSSGCSESRSEGTTTGLAALSESITATKLQINKTVVNLQKLKTGEDIKGSYSQFSDNLAGVKSSAAKVKGTYESLQSQADSYVTTWQKEVEGVNDPALKATALERSAKVKGAVGEITKSMEAAKDAYQPLVTVMDDLQKVIGNDATVEGVKSAAPAIDKAIANAVDVQVKLGAITTELDTLRGSLTPTSK